MYRKLEYAMHSLTPLEQLDLSRFDTLAILKKLASASRQLAELKGVAAAIPNQGILINTLGLHPANVNPMGGAIAHGHPLDATGAIRAATVVHALRRHKLKYGMVTMCVGTGQGAAGIIEAL